MEHKNEESADIKALREKLNNSKSDNEKAITRFRESLEEKRAAEEKRLHEEFNDDNVSLSIIADLHPEIPITKPLPFPFTVETKTHYNVLREHETPNFSTGQHFALNGGDGHFICDYIQERDETVVLEERHGLVGEYHYLGKRVVVAPEGGEASETDDLITLAPCPPEIDIDDYCLSLYRKNAVVQSYAHYYPSAKDYFKSIHHFGGVPWKLKDKRVGNYFDLIFKNMETKTVRRYIIRGEASEYFMLQGEIFAVDESTGKILIIRCSTGEVVCEPRNRGLTYDCGRYAVTTTGRSLIFFVAVPLPAPVLGEEIEVDHEE